MNMFIKISVFFNKTLYVQTNVFNDHEHRKSLHSEKPTRNS
jgi:hypothetical protein